MKNINKPKKTYQRKNSVSSFSSKMKLKMKDLNTNQLKDNNTINKINAKEEDNKKFIKKHTWVYDQLFVKNNIVDERKKKKKKLLLLKVNFYLINIIFYQKKFIN